MSGINLGQFIIEGGPLDNSQQAAQAPSFDPSQFIIEGGPLGNVQQPQSTWDKVVNYSIPTVASNVLQGVTFGFGDEIAAGVGSMLPGRTYDSELQRLRALQNASEEQMPILSTGMQIVGGLPYAALGTAQRGATAFSKALQSGAVGGLVGALYGAGDTEGDYGDRGMNALTGAGVGAGAGAGLSAVGSVVGAGIKSGPVQELIDRAGIAARRIAGSEVGKIGTDISQGAAGKAMPDKADYVLAKALRQTDPTEISAATNELAQALADSQPMFMPEAFATPGGNPSLNAFARQIANSNEGRDFAQRAIANRKDQALSRVTGILDDVAPYEDLATAGKGLAEAADAPVQAAIQARREAASPLYQALREQFPTVEQSPRLQQLLQEPYVQQGIEQARKLGKFADAPETDIQLLDRAKGFLDDKIEAARRTGENRQAADLQEIKSALVSELDRLTTPAEAQESLYKAARNAYRTASKDVDGLSEGALNVLQDLTGPDTPKAVKNLMSLTEQQISEVRDALGEEGQGALKKAVRSYLQDLAESKKDGFNHVRGMVDNEKMRGKLRAALGPDFDLVEQRLSREQTFADFYPTYHTGSSTATNIRDAEDLARSYGLVQQIAERGPIRFTKDKLRELFISDYNPLADALAQRIFDPTAAQETLSRVAPIVQRFAGRERLVDALAQGTANTGAVAASAVKPKPKKQP